MKLLHVKIRNLREQLKLTQTEFGKIFSLSKQTISGYENGENVPPLETVYKIAEHFNLSIDELLDRDKKYTGSVFSTPQIAETLSFEHYNIKKQIKKCYGDTITEAIILLDDLSEDGQKIALEHTKLLHKTFRKN